MTSNRPYLLRALNEWILDNGMTPYILIDAENPGTRVPREFIQEGKIVLNITPTAVKGLVIGNDELVCSARFAGKPVSLSCPMAAITAIYARENGYGMIFPDEDLDEGVSEESGTEQTGSGRPDLKVVK